MGWQEAFRLQQQMVEERKRGEGCDHILFVEHPHVVTMGRNASEKQVLASPEILQRSGIQFFETDRGGGATYHGPGQIVGYPILDLRDWKCDVRLYFRALEQFLIDALATFGIDARRNAEKGHEGVWVGNAKIAAIGVHISRWITSHGFALNVENDLSYFQYIVPCGLSKPVCSLRSLGCAASIEEAKRALVTSFAVTFGYADLVAQNQGSGVRDQGSESGRASTASGYLPGEDLRPVPGLRDRCDVSHGLRRGL
jgi:lipoate-protein ligase B